MTPKQILSCAQYSEVELISEIHRKSARWSEYCDNERCWLGLDGKSERANLIPVMRIAWSSHLYPLQAANFCRNSRLVVDEDDPKWVANEKYISSLLKQFHENFRSESPRCRKLRHSSEMRKDALVHREDLKDNIGTASKTLAQHTYSTGPTSTLSWDALKVKHFVTAGICRKHSQ